MGSWLGLSASLWSQQSTAWLCSSDSHANGKFRGPMCFECNEPCQATSPRKTAHVITDLLRQNFITASAQTKQEAEEHRTSNYATRNNQPARFSNGQGRWRRLGDHQGRANQTLRETAPGVEACPIDVHPLVLLAASVSGFKRTESVK